MENQTQFIIYNSEVERLQDVENVQTYNESMDAMAYCFLHPWITLTVISTIIAIIYIIHRLSNKPKFREWQIVTKDGK